MIPRFLEAALTNRPLTIYGGAQVLDMLPVGAAVGAMVQAGTGCWKRGAFNIGSGTGITVAEVARRIIEASGSDSRLEILPRRDVEVSSFVADTRRARAKLGLDGEMGLLPGLEGLVEAARVRTATAERIGAA
jgi:UDP-glucose 4-epimerase